MILKGFGENARVLEWIFKRCDNEEIYDKTALGFVPKPGAINTKGLDVSDETMKKLMTTEKDFILQEVKELRKYFDDQINTDLPKEMEKQLNMLEERAKAMK